MSIRLKCTHCVSTKGRFTLQANWEVTGREGCGMSQRPFEVDPEQTELCASLGNTLGREKKKSHCSKHRHYRKSELSYCFSSHDALLLSHLMMILSCFSVSTSFTFSLCNLMRVQQYEEVCTTWTWDSFTYGIIFIKHLECDSLSFKFWRYSSKQNIKKKSLHCCTNIHFVGGGINKQ